MILPLEYAKDFLKHFADEVSRDSNDEHRACCGCINLGFVFFGIVAANSCSPEQKENLPALAAHTLQLLYQNDRLGLRDFALSLRDTITQEGLNEVAKDIGESVMDEIKSLASIATKPSN